MKALYHSRTFLGKGVFCFFAILLSGLVRGEESTDGVVSAEAAAYAVLVKADEARDHHEFQDAVDHYKNASELYQAVSQAAPDWEPDVMQYRLSYCADQIQSIGRQMAAGGKSTPPRPAAGPKRATEIFDSLTQANESLHRSLVEIQSRLSNLEGASDLKMDLQKLADENGQFYQALVNARAEAEKDPVGTAKNTRKYEQKSESLKTQFLGQKEKAQAFIRQSEANEEEEWEPAPQPASIRGSKTSAAAPAPQVVTPAPSPEPPWQEVVSETVPEKIPAMPQPAEWPPADDEDIFAPVPMGNSGGGQ